MKQAMISAVKERLSPKGNCLKKIICPPLKTRLSSIAESRKEEKMKHRARIFLRLRLTRPASGKSAEPSIGIKMARSKIVSGMLIK
jgi:hypothetical protein